jgi:hypothetical protein
MDTLAPRRFAIGISYQKRNARFAENLAEKLANSLGRDVVFFDRFHPHEFFGANAKADLIRIYTEETEVVVPLFTRHYGSGGWSNIEWSHIARFLDTGRVLPVVLDDLDDTATPPGWPGSGIAIKGKGRKTAKVAEDILKSRRMSVRATAEGKKNRDRTTQMESGFLVVADIWDFSALPPAEMEPVIDAMWRIGIELGLISRNRAVGLLDGLVLTVRSLRYGDLVRQCESWIARLRQETIHNDSRRPGAELRVAIHRGDYYVVESRQLVLGSGPNECSRLVQVAGPGQIVLSEEFVNGWKRDIGWTAGHSEMRELFPRPSKAPFGVQLPFAPTQSYFRYYKYGIDKPIFFTPLHQIDQVERILHQIVRDIEDEFIDLIQDRSPRFTRSIIDARVSIYVFDRNRPEESRLVATDFRYPRQQTTAARERRLNGRTTTFYEFASKNGPQGPIARAFVEKQPMTLAHLPAYRSSKKSCRYVSLLSGEPWNIPAATIHGFSRKARCFLAVPCWLNKTAAFADAVVCIDTMHPLTTIPAEFLQECAQGFRLYFGTLISALIRLRS